MSYVEYRGKLVSWDDEAVHDAFADADIVFAWIETETGRKQVSIKAGVPFVYKYTQEIIPAIGDTIAVGWDYANFTGKIITLADGEREQMPEAFPVAGSRPMDLNTLLDSLFPPA